MADANPIDVFMHTLVHFRTRAQQTAMLQAKQCLDALKAVIYSKVGSTCPKHDSKFAFCFHIITISVAPSDHYRCRLHKSVNVTFCCCQYFECNQQFEARVSISEFWNKVENFKRMKI